MLVRDQITRAAKLYPNHVAAICGAEQRTLREIDERSSRLANALLGLGLQRGDRVALWLDNSIRAIEADFALAKAGLVKIALNPRATPRDAEFILHDADVRAMIYDPRHAEAALEIAPRTPQITRRISVGPPPLAKFDDGLAYETLLAAASAEAPDQQVNPEDLLWLLYTSGSSGRPKGVMLSQRSVLQTAYNVLLELGPAAGEKILLLQPLSHGAGFYLLPYFMRGAVVVLMPHFEVGEALELARRLDIQAMKLVPTMLQRMLDAPELAPALLSLKRVIYGGSAIPVEVLRRAIETLGTRLVQHYGQSEAPSTLTILPQEDHTVANIASGRLGSAGRPWATVELRIVNADGQTVPSGELGEVAVRAPHVMSGYWGQPEMTAGVLRDGWLYTSDLGRLDASGFLHLAGRKDEMIVSGGYNIAPREVEEVLYQHPAIREAAVVGEQDCDWGQAVVAFISLRNEVGVDEILKFTRPLLGYKNPKRIHVLAELPKNANGKIQKSLLTTASRA